ncbi:MAG TPA: hypothetical protein VK866_06050 [Acidimicrobiales bacterium]|nr:hypothetical protein [Acidimicrobiales bacterium]
MITRRILIALLGALVALGLSVAPAAAQVGDQHAGGEDVLDEDIDRTPPGDAAPPQVGGAGALPVTGSDVAGLVGLATVALVGGMALVTLTRRHSPTR